MMSIKTYSTHCCNLTNQPSESCLPKLPPHASQWRKLTRYFRKLTIVDKEHPGLKAHFKSSSAVLLERKRQIYSHPWFIIHPLSKLALFNDLLAASLWTYSFVMDPFLAGFWSGDAPFKLLSGITNLTNCILLAQCMVWFVTGYYIDKTNEFVLQPRKIMFSYLTSYFIWDLIGCFPLQLIMVNYYHGLDEIVCNIAFLVSCCKIARIKCLFQRVRWVTLLFNVSDRSHIYCIFALLSVFTIHWSCCGLYIYHRFLYYVQGFDDPNSVLSTLKISPAYRHIDWFNRYIVTTHVVIEVLCSAGETLSGSYSMTEQPVLVVLMVYGAIYYLVCFITVYLQISATAAPEQAYEEFIGSVNVFMDSKKLPQELRDRILLYFDRRYQKKHFKEKNLVSYLSDHLQHEVWLHSCQRLLNHVAFFKLLPKTVVGIILGSLKLEVFLPRDVILKAQEPLSNMFFISWGTVAVYTDDETELLHLTDGMHFGFPPMSKFRTVPVNYTFTAVEMTECYRWDKDSYQKCVKAFKGITRIMEDLYERITLDFQYREETLRKYKNRSIISELRQGRILDVGRRRLKFSKNY